VCSETLTEVFQQLPYFLLLLALFSNFEAKGSKYRKNVFFNGLTSLRSTLYPPMQFQLSFMFNVHTLVFLATGI
jgi:hypothetical protein